MMAEASKPDPRAQCALRAAEGERLLSIRRFADAFDVLDQALSEDRRNPRIIVLMGIACLYQNFHEDAEHFFRKAIDLDYDNTDARSGLAYVLMKSDRAAEAAEELCDILRVAPHHRFARKRFQELKSAPSIEAYAAGLHPSRFVALPAKKRFEFLSTLHIPPYIRKIAIGVIVLCVLLLIYIISSQNSYSGIFGGPGKEGAPDPNFPSGTVLDTDIGKSLARAMKAAENPPELFLSDPEVSSLLARAMDSLKFGNYNEARYILNRILASNADHISLSTARQLENFLKNPPPDKMDFNPDLTSIDQEGPLYRGVYVQWLTQVVRATNGNFLQVAPARYHGNEDDSIQVIVVDDNAHNYARGTMIEVFGDVLGVDKISDTQNVVYLAGKRLVRIQRNP
ncbi:MAG: hypothetical protein LBC99_05755 [Spirochaetota bacterium]|jgi:tetratricopeptide (TPR) repeat protein|nr:hypothetical protein [Spirochaetota bacterium]